MPRAFPTICVPVAPGAPAAPGAIFALAFLAALGSLPMPAAAQTTLTVYGIADVGLSFDRTGVAGTGTAVRIESSHMSTSRFGLTGTEDLGGGNKAVFTLEMGVHLDTGAFATTSTDVAGFNRRAIAGLQTRFGTLVLGRDHTPVYQALQALDNMGFGLYGSLKNSPRLADDESNQFFRADNAIFYRSPKLAGGLSLRALYSAGRESFGGSGPGAVVRHDGRLVGLGAEYEAGALTAALAWQARAVANSAGTDTADRRDVVIGARYDFGAFTLGGGYERVDPPGSGNAGAQAWLGGTVRIGRGTVRAQVARMRLQAAVAGVEPRSDTFAVAYTYPFSRRTTGYVSVGYVANNAAADLGLYASDTEVSPGSGAAARGADPRGLAVGIRHTF